MRRPLARTRTERKRGRYIQARPARRRTDDLAFDATLRAAAPFSSERAEQRKRVAFAIRSGDYSARCASASAANLILFLVDASWSMAVAERMAATKGAIMSLLTDAYQRRDRVGLVVFQKDRATLVLPPTNSVELAQARPGRYPRRRQDAAFGRPDAGLRGHPAGKRLHPDVMPLMILLTDGAGNVSMTDLPPQEEAHQHRRADRTKTTSAAWSSTWSTPPLTRVWRAQLAEHLGGPCYTLRELKAEHLYRAVRLELNGQPA